MTQTQIVPTILVVDDTKENLQVIAGILGEGYKVRVATSGAKALSIAESAPVPDLILLDVMMPEMDGHQVLRILKSQAHTQGIPVIFVTAMDGSGDEELGLSLGAVDYITKPVQPAILLARVKTHLELKAARDVLENQNVILDREVQRQTFELDLIKDVSLMALSTLAEARDNETGNHLFRTQAYIELLMGRLLGHPRFSELSDEAYRQRVAHAAPLHDIGKVGVPDTILLKPGKLTDEEFSVMKRHSQIGADAITAAIARVVAMKGVSLDSVASGSALAFLDMAKQIAVSHHEKWDGSGYPNKLAGDEIPLSGRLMALADVFDALSSRRPYKEAFPRDKVVPIILQGRGTHFDPDIVDAFEAMQDKFFEIAVLYEDKEGDLQ